LLSELRHAWARAVPESPQARVFRAAESGAEEILTSFHGTSLFTARELLIVLDLEGLARSERNVRALAEGVARPAGGSCLTLVESAADTPRKTLETLRAACEARVVAVPLGLQALLGWGRRRLAREQVTVEAGVLEMLAQACENDTSEFFNELDKLIVWAGPGGKLGREEAARLLRPILGADLEDYLDAVAEGDAPAAARRLGRLLAGGAGEGSVMFALANLVGGAMGGWARNRDLSQRLARRATPADLTRGLDALYRAEAAWKRGRADVVAVLEQATREVCGGGRARAGSPR
jgi:DNA polymerase III delta subunit